MRTPNAACIVCAKPLYRRPGHLALVRHVACIAHRAEAQKLSGITEAQQSGLSKGRAKGTNHRAGYTHRAESKAKTSATNKAFWAANPDLLALRGAQVRGEAHYAWNGGSSRLNTSIRQMTENRRWIDAVKARDGCCTRCSSTETLESHHLVELAVLIERLGIKSRDDARTHAAVLWDLENGATLCQPCHYQEHGRKRYAD